MKHKTLILVGLLLIAGSLALAACGAPTPAPQPAPTLEPLRTPDPQPVQECPEPVVCPEPVEALSEANIPFYEQWVTSGHADAEAIAFTYWDSANPPEVPIACAKCHSSEGFIDFMGADGSPHGEVNTSPQKGSPITCTACHNEATVVLDNVVFPSGAELANLGNEAVCMQCHQGRASIVQVEAAIERVGLTGEDDTTNEELGFVNIHYYAAAATQYGSMVKGGYEYEGLRYDPRFEHVEGYNTCIGCHNPHTLEVRLAECTVCHTDVTSLESVRNIRMEGSLVDYDGDGDIREGLSFEVAGLQEILYQSIQAYAEEVSGTPIVYDSHSHPYFFTDKDGNGEVTEGEAVRDNAYKSWSPRLLKAAYNYQTSLKDPGAFVHGGKYIIQLLHDSILDINSAVSAPVETAGLHREDAGHFRAASPAFRYWDSTGVVPAACSKCHSGEGLPLFLAEAGRAADQVSGITVGLHPTMGLDCSTCHDNVATFTRFQVNQVKFPSNAVLSFGEGDDNNLCLNCHQGREANRTVQEAIRRTNVTDNDAVAPGLTFRNPHYFAAGATLFGTEAQGAFQYEGKEYNGRFMHVANLSTCIQCHDAHALEIQVQVCSGCHQGVGTLEALRTIRLGSPDLDFDGNGQLEGVGIELQNMQTALFEAIQAYAEENADTAAIVYDSHSHPYWYIDTNGNGEADPDEVNRNNQYNTWTPRLLRAAYNYQWSQKDPGAFAHNGMYMIQALYDSLEDIGWDVSSMNRPPVESAQ